MYEVNDMYFAAVLFAYNAAYAGVDRADRRNQKFLFEKNVDVKKIFIEKHGIVDEIDNPTFEMIQSAYDTVTLLYPTNYVEALRRVKGIIHK